MGAARLEGMTPPVRQEVLVVTGMSGAGRSTVADSLEDLGWYVVDNLPPTMLQPLLELARRARENLPKIAAVVDIRGREFFAQFQEIVAVLRQEADLRVVFLDASDDALIRRFEAVRRPHPLQGDGSLSDGITRERRRLADVRASSDWVLDTTELNVHQLSARVREEFAAPQTPGVQVTIMSFGFKHGLPLDADMVGDVRFLPNPHWNAQLRQRTGLDFDVSAFVLAQPGAAEFLDGYTAVLMTVLQGYQNENKHHALIAVGCTGGRHRSVAMSEELAKRIAGNPNLAVNVRHRDIDRDE